MNNITPTAEEFLQENNVVGMTDLMTPLMIEFTKLHCKEQLRAICKKVKIYNNSDIDLVDSVMKYVKVDKDSIRKAYDLNQIK